MFTLTKGVNSRIEDIMPQNGNGVTRRDGGTENTEGLYREKEERITR
jgi:hypothetical protein